MDIRFMKSSDLDSAAKLYLAAYGVDWTEQGARTYLEKFFLIEPTSCYVAVEGDTVLGAVLGYTFEREVGLTLFIQELMVHPDYRHQGVAKKLVSKLRDSCVKAPSRVRVKPLVKADTVVLNFYNSLGFEKDTAISFSFDD